MNEAAKISEVLKGKALFRVCGDGFIDKLASGSRIQKADKGKILFLTRDPATQFFIILKGWVKLYRETLDGTQAVVDTLTIGHMFGETSIFEDDTYSCSAEAIEPLEYISLPLGLLKAEIEGNSKFALKMLSSMANYRRQQDQELEHRTLQNAPQRIGCFLLRLADQDADGPISIHLPYDKTVVASRLGMQPETFSRALAKLRDATGIKISGATIKVDNLNQLSDFSCSACSSEFPCNDLQEG